MELGFLLVRILSDEDKKENRKHEDQDEDKKYLNNNIIRDSKYNII